MSAPTPIAHPRSHAARIIAILIAGALLSACSEPADDHAPAPNPSDIDIAIAPLAPPVRDDWPTDGWPTAAPLDVGIDPAKLDAAADYAMTMTGIEQDRTGIRTDGLVIVRHGRIVLERYGRGYGPDTPHRTWSVSKSFVNALYGIAVRDQRVDIDTPAARYIPALKRPDRASMTIRHLLNMSSGLIWSEGYESSPLKSTVVAMLYTRGRADMAGFAAAQEMRARPGRYIYYSSGDSNLLMGILKQIVPADEYHDYAWRELFDVIGMDGVTWERDASGTLVGSSYVFATPRALAKFGYLYLNDGIWDGTQVLAPGWVTFTRTPAPAYLSTPAYEGIEASNRTAQWYANTGIPQAHIPPPWPDAPRDTFAAQGHWGQAIFVIPSLDMVIVRVGDDRDGSLDKNELLKLIAASVTS